MKVDYNLVNMNNCACCICTKQRHNSICAREKTRKVQAMEAKGIDAISLLEPKEFSWLYCATSKAVCEDLNFEEECKSKDCEVWKEYKLDRSEIVDYFCRKGASL